MYTCCLYVRVHVYIYILFTCMCTYMCICVHVYTHIHINDICIIKKFFFRLELTYFSLQVKL